jgi:hypothetical protein
MEYKLFDEVKDEAISHIKNKICKYYGKSVDFSNVHFDKVKIGIALKELGYNKKRITKDKITKTYYYKEANYDLQSNNE